MARIEGNDLTLGLRGKIGKQLVFRKYRQRTVAARKAEGIADAATADQVQHRDRFRLAALYAKRALKIPELKAEYEAMADAKNGGGAFSAALADYLKPVTVSRILTTAYTGATGLPIVIMVSDVFKVKTMKVTLTDRNGQLIESGDALLPVDSFNFVYTTAVAVPDITGVVIKVEATDRPGNVAVFQVTV